MIRMVIAKPARLLLALILALPAGVGLNGVVAHAQCYYSQYLYDTVSATPAGGVTYTSTVQYTVGYNCSGTPTTYNVSWFQDSMTFSAGAYHETNQGGFCDYFNPSPWYCHNVWHQYFNPVSGCTGKCTIYKTVYPSPGAWRPYDARAAVWTHWYGCDTRGGGSHCDLNHQFFKHQAYSTWYG